MHIKMKIVKIIREFYEYSRVFKSAKRFHSLLLSDEWTMLKQSLCGWAVHRLETE